MDSISTRLAKWLRDPSVYDSDPWPGFAEDAGVRGLAGVVLERCGQDALLSRRIRLHLERFRGRTASENVHVLRRVAPVLGALDRAGIQVMLLKGVGLISTLYADSGLRPMSDVDLLVRPGDARRTIEVMESAGCRRGAALLREDFFPRFHYETELLIPGPRAVRLDLHARPFRPMRSSRIIPDDAIWEGAQAVCVGDARAYVARAELFFVQLAAHAAFHGCSRLIWLYDLVSLARFHGGGFDWEAVLRTCRSWRLGLAVRTAIREAERHLGGFVPPDVVAKLEAQPTGWRDRLSLRQAPRDAESPWRHVLVNLLCTPGLSFKAGYVWSLLTPDAPHLREQAILGRGLLAARLQRAVHILIRAMQGVARSIVGRRRFA